MIRWRTIDCLPRNQLGKCAATASTMAEPILLTPEHLQSACRCSIFRRSFEASVPPSDVAFSVRNLLEEKLVGSIYYLRRKWVVYESGLMEVLSGVSTGQVGVLHHVQSRK